MFPVSFVIPGLVPGIHLSACSGAGWPVDTGDKPRYDVLPQRHPARRRPFQAFYRAGTRPVLAADPSVVAAGVDLLEQPSVVEIARIRFAAIGRIGDLVMPGQPSVLLKRDGHVA